MGLPMPRKAAALLASACAQELLIFLPWAVGLTWHNFSDWSSSPAQ